MAERRIELHEHLINVLNNYGSVITTSDGWIWLPMGDREQAVQVYFQPPESLQIQYPCLIYELKEIRKLSADNKTYAKFHAYELLFITWNPDSPIVDILVDLPMCSMSGRPYESDNLYHYAYTLYY